MSGDTEFIIQHLGTTDDTARGGAVASTDKLPESLPSSAWRTWWCSPAWSCRCWSIHRKAPASSMTWWRATGSSASCSNANPTRKIPAQRICGPSASRGARAQDAQVPRWQRAGCWSRAVWRVVLKEYTSEKPYLRALGQVLPDPPSTSLEAAALLRTAQNQFQQIINLSPGLSETVKVQALNTEEPGRFADLIASNMNLGLDERQRLLETAGANDRLKRLLPLMSRELEVLTLGSKIQNEVTTSMSKTQRDFFLREQLRAIQRELGDGDPGATESADLRKNIETAKLPPEVRKVALKELERLQQTPSASPEFAIIAQLSRPHRQPCRGTNLH